MLIMRLGIYRRRVDGGRKASLQDKKRRTPKKLPAERSFDQLAEMEYAMNILKNARKKALYGTYSLTAIIFTQKRGLQFVSANTPAATVAAAVISGGINRSHAVSFPP